MAPFSATILNLIFKLSSGYLLAIFDFEIHMMPRCFLLLPLLVLCKFCSCQSDNNSLFAVCCLFLFLFLPGSTRNYSSFKVQKFYLTISFPLVICNS